MPTLASLPGNIFSSVFDVGLVFGSLVFGATNNFSCLFYFASFQSFLLLPKTWLHRLWNEYGQVKAVVHRGQDYAVAPLLLPPYPSQYCFPERRQIKINLNSSTESDTSGNACGALNYMFCALCMLCALVTKYLCIYLFLQWGNNQHNRNWNDKTTSHRR